MDNCRDDIYHFLDSERGQIAIFDAVNPLASSRRALAADFAEHNIEVCVSFLPVTSGALRRIGCVED